MTVCFSLFASLGYFYDQNLNRIIIWITESELTLVSRLLSHRFLFYFSIISKYISIQSQFLSLVMIEMFEQIIKRNTNKRHYYYYYCYYLLLQIWSWPCPFLPNLAQTCSTLVICDMRVPDWRTTACAPTLSHQINTCERE